MLVIKIFCIIWLLIGAMLASRGLNESRLKGALGKLQDLLNGISDAKIAFAALAVLAVTRIAFLECPSFALGLIPIMFGGICTGLNAITTQSLRRKLTTSDQFPEIAGLEVVLGKITDWLISSALFYLIAANYVDYRLATYFAAVLLVLLGVLHLFGSPKTT